MTRPPSRFVASATRPSSPTEEIAWFAWRGGDLLVRARNVQDVASLAVPIAATPEQLGLEPVRSQYLGTLDGRDCYAAELAPDAAAPEGHQLLSLRRLFGQLDPVEFDVAGIAFQIQYWDRAYSFCPACATPLTLKSTERAKHCAPCALDYFPRIAPATIVLIHDGNRVLLTRQSRFPEGMFGLVAGFLEPGETLEQCAAREVREETGLEIDSLAYAGSQPWPFPHQVMVGFTARYAGGTLVVDKSELEDARWFDANAMPQIPPPLSIARKMLDAWLATRV